MAYIAYRPAESHTLCSSPFLPFPPHSGCIAAEMVICAPLFPGRSHLDQLQVWRQERVWPEGQVWRRGRVSHTCAYHAGPSPSHLHQSIYSQTPRTLSPPLSHKARPQTPSPPPHSVFSGALAPCRVASWHRARTCWSRGQSACRMRGRPRALQPSECTRRPDPRMGGCMRGVEEGRGVV